MLDNSLPNVPGKGRYEYIVYDATDTLLAVFRTDDPQSISLVKSFAEEYLAQRIGEHPSNYRIEFLDNNKLVDKRIQEKYRSP